MSVTRKISVVLVLVTVMCLAASASFAQSPTLLEYPYIYKSTRAMGMGGAYTAVGGRVDTLFYNPAGLINIPKDKGWEVNLINLSVELGKNIADMSPNLAKGDFGKDTIAQDATDAMDKNLHPDDSDQAIIDVAAKYVGKNVHARVADFTSVGASWDRWAFGVGGIGSGRVDAMLHEGFGSEGVAEVNVDALYGGIGGVSIGVTDSLFLGLSVKQLHRENIFVNLSPGKFAENSNNIDTYLQDLQKKGDAVGFDAGLIWKFAPDSWFRPSLGVSVMNIGDLKFTNDAGVMPQTVNTGIAINPDLSWARSFIVGLDYIDVANGYKQDKDLPKRIRYGAELQLFDILPIELALRAGMYMGSPTYGADLRLLFLTVSYAAYTEEVGAYAGQDKDARQLLTLNLGW